MMNDSYQEARLLCCSRKFSELFVVRECSISCVRYLERRIIEGILLLYYRTYLVIYHSIT